MRASIEHINNDIKIMGGFACFPYFLGSKPIGSELSKNHEQSLLYRFWMVAYPSARGGIDNPMMNPWAEDAPSLSGLVCSRLLVCVGEKDKLRDRGVRYCEELRKSGWKGEVELVEIEGEDHCFHIFNPGTENAKNLVKRLASFIIQKLPILVYFRRGFCAGSAFSSDHHCYINTLVSQAKILAISVEYRVAPEHPLPTAYEDSWTALQWVSSHKVRNNIDPESKGVCPIIGSSNPVIYHEFRWDLQLSGASATNTQHLNGSFLDQEPWLLDHADFERLFIGGDTTGANIVHNITLRAGVEDLHGNTKILGTFLCQPYFWGSKLIRSESSLGHQNNMICRSWKFVYPTAAGGIDNPMINPFAAGAPRLSGIRCSRVLVCVGQEDVTKYRGIQYCESLRESGWEGEVELYEVQGGEHGFHIRNPETEIAKNMIKRLATFLQ
ncbi:hypothetical protein RJ639_041657 [Escallonia herrerae]|uniref:Alpha/beta hydrolase fold-3 domain-containing protein n=1 Tax=Escallonia herrerae TaxID=1293975 RepID=A0AA89B2T6_9ASTE|nr:hypothetical protein RJ639_041657 [Escallonia herrerae]